MSPTKKRARERNNREELRLLVRKAEKLRDQLRALVMETREFLERHRKHWMAGHTTDR